MSVFQAEIPITIHINENQYIESKLFLYLIQTENKGDRTLILFKSPIL